MTVSPPLNPILMLLEGNGSLAGRDRSGAFTATGSGALRYAPAPGARINYVRNPLVGNSVAGWVQSGTSVTSSTDWTEYGPYCGKLTVTSLSGSSGAFTDTSGANFIRLSGGQQYTLSVPVYNPQSSPRSVAILWRSFDLAAVSTGNLQGKIYFTVPAQSSAVFTVTATLPAGAEGCYVVVYADNGGAAPFQNGDVLYVGGVRINDGSTDLGHIPAPIWLDPRTGQLGTAYASPSVSRAVFWVEEATTNLVTNPRFETNTTSWFSFDAGGFLSGVRDTTKAFLGSASYKVTASADVVATGAEQLASFPVVSPSAGVVTQSWYVWIPTAFSATSLSMVWANYAGVTGSATLLPVDFGKRNQWQRIAQSATLDVGDLSGQISLRLTNGGGTMKAGESIWIACVQCEQKAYATSYCDGSLGTGYSWAGTAHASASTRAVALVSVPATSHYTPNAGAMLARGYRDVVTGGAAIVQVTPFGDPVYDGLQFRAGVGLPQAVAASWWIANASGFVQSGASDMPATTWIKPYTDWSGTVVRSGIGISALATGGRPAGAIGTGPGALLYIGPYNAPTFGRIGPVLTYDQPLSDARRALVNAAIDSNGTIDLWTLFEEWEAVGLPLESVALQAGQATAGVKAVALPMETSVLQDGRGTAGVKAVALPMEAVERQGGKALAFDGARLIPVPDTRSVIVIGEQ